jgi:HK97 family phage major capsid protein
VAEFLGSALGTRIGRITNRDFTLGTGSANPNGIVNAATLGKTGATGQQASVIYGDLVDLEHSVDPAYRAGARFMMHDQSLKVIKKLVDSQGRPLWMPGLVGGAPDTILGYPFTINQDLATMATSAKSILFGDFSKYIIRDVAEVSVLRLDERFAEFHQVAFLAFARVDGDLLDAGTNPVKWYANT